MHALASASASDDYRPARRSLPIRPRREEERDTIDYGSTAPAAFTAASYILQPNGDRFAFSDTSTSESAFLAKKRRDYLMLQARYAAMWPSSVLSATQMLRGENAALTWRELSRTISVHETRVGILERLKAVHEAASEEGVEVIQASENQLRLYLLGQLRPTMRPAISMSESGYLTATWRDADGQQVGVQFRGDGWVHYFVFARRPEGALTSHAGRLELSEVLPLLKHLGVTNLIYR